MYQTERHNRDKKKFTASISEQKMKYHQSLVSLLVTLSYVSGFVTPATHSPGVQRTFLKSSQMQEQTKVVKNNQIKAGDKLPWADLHYNFPPQMVNTVRYCLSKKVIVLGVKGAYLPSANRTIQSYIENTQALKECARSYSGLAEEDSLYAVLVVTQNDGAVLRGWSKDSKMKGSLLLMLGDPSGDFFEQCGMLPSTREDGYLNGRGEQFAMYVDNCIVKHVAVSSSCDSNYIEDDDPTLAHNMLEQVKEVVQRNN